MREGATTIQEGLAIIQEGVAPFYTSGVASRSIWSDPPTGYGSVVLHLISLALGAVCVYIYTYI